tara:strand:- start:2372 stop:3469 length:1098 start_codon:yes stop_codon:yes gene_type:complete
MRKRVILLAALLAFSCDNLFEIFPPEISIISPSEGQTVSSPVDVEVDVDDNDKVDRVEITLEDQTIKETMMGDPWQISLEVPSGEQKIIAKAFDMAGNFNTAEVKIVVPEPSESDVLTITSPTTGDKWYKSNTYQIKWSDNVGLGSSHYLHIYLYKTGSLIERIRGNASNTGSRDWTVPDYLVDGDDYTIRITRAASGELYAESYTFSILAGSGDGGSEQGTYLSEDFEGDINEWYTGDSFSWSITDTKSYSGSRSAMSATVDNGQTSYLYKKVETPTYGSVTVSYYLWVECPYSNNNADFYLYITGNNSSSRSELFHYSGMMSDWQEFSSSINLGSIATPPTLTWEIAGNSGSCKCYVDLVKVN